jgi:hypothetical protein
LFVMNSAFVQDRADALAKSVEGEQGVDAEVRGLYRRLFGRDPSGTELRAARGFLETSTLVQYAQALLSTNEVIFWP